MANAPVPVTADVNIKVRVDLNLQLRRHTGTLIFTSIHPDVSNDSFFMKRIEQNNSI